MPKKAIRSELLTLLNARKSWEGKPYVRPLIGPTLMARIEEAVRCVKQLDNSNPFAGVRAHHYLINGYCLPSEVLKDCKTLTALRAKEPKGGERVELIKAKRLAEEKQRQADADKAWNQHNSKLYLEEKAA